MLEALTKRLPMAEETEAQANTRNLCICTSLGLGIVYSDVFGKG